MDALFISTLAVAIAEIGDKTQLLALVLAARFRKPWPIVAGILVATLANHAAAGAVGVWVAEQLSAQVLRWGLALSFFAIAAWALVPDKMDDATDGKNRYGAFLTTLVAFFLVEIGDKTQVATVALAMHYQDLTAVVAGTTVGMLLANVPVVLIGSAAASRIPLTLVRRLAAAMFVVLGLFTLLGS